MVEAWQWSPGVRIEGVYERVPELVFSTDNTYFYLSGDFNGRLADAWLSIEPGKPSLPFVFWEVKSGDRRRALPGDPLVKRYLSHMHLELLPPSTAYLETSTGGCRVFPNDWVVKDERGNLSVCSRDLFSERYESLEDSQGQQPT